MKNTILKFQKEINKLDTLAIVLIIFFIVIVGLAPIIFTQSWTRFDFTKTGDIGSTIGGITAPFIGLLSALLVFLSFRAQINANRYQLEAIQTERENRETENEITFLYHRLEEIKENGITQQFRDTLPQTNGLLDNLISTGYTIIKNTTEEPNQVENKKSRIQKIEKEKINLTLNLSRHLSLYIIVIDKLNDIKSKISQTQFEYLESSLRFEYLNSISAYSKLYIQKINLLTTKDLLDKESLLLSIHKYLNYLESKINPSA